MQRQRNRGQSMLEYTILIVIILGVFIAMKDYIKRGIQGRWKASVDDLGDQYDPRLANGYMNYVTATNSDTHIVTIPDRGGYYTNRTDTTNSVETKAGTINVSPP